MKNIVLLGLLVTGILFIVTTQLKISRQQDNKVQSVLLMQAPLATCEWVYEQDGRTIHSLSDLERTAYYPFNEPYSKVSDGQCSMTTAGDCSDLYLTGSIKRHGFSKTIHRRYHINGGNCKKVTLRMLQSYTSGVQHRIGLIQEVRYQFIQRLCEKVSSSRDKDVPSVPMGHDLPTDQQELKLYVAWLEQTEGLNQLTDAWGRPLVFSLSNGTLRCRSSGPDGIEGTQDDLSVKVPISRTFGT